MRVHSRAPRPASIMTSGSLNERITRALAFMLRHQPEEFDLELDRFGWGDLEDVVYALQERIGSQIEEDDVVEAIGASDRQRYEIEDDKIRALYGHSFPIDPGEPTEPPDELFIGVGSRDAARAEESGLRSGRRAFLHLARTETEAREAGRRAAPEYSVITVFAGEAYDEGIDFYDRGSLFLADEVPVEFIEVGETYTDGFERDHGRRSRGRRNNEGPRGRGGRGRGRGRGRDDDDRGPRGRGRDDDDRPSRGRDRDDEGGRDREPKRDRDEAPKGGDRSHDRDGEGRAPARDRKPERAPREDREPRRESKPRADSDSGSRPEPRSEPSPKREAPPTPAPKKGGFGAGIG